MKIIDLLNKIANGEEVPKKIKINNEIWIYEADIDYRASDDRGYLFEVNIRTNKEDLNNEVEILEEEKKSPTLNNIRESYGLPRIEEKKDNFTGWKMYQDGKEVCSMDCIDKLNNVIDYLKSKGE